MPIIVIWLVLAVIAGAVASSKGRSFIGWFLFAVFLSPLIGLIAVALLASKNPVPVQVIGGTYPTDAASSLKSLGVLRDGGVITPEEYEAKRAEVIVRV
jgi:hypothetical protein